MSIDIKTLTEKDIGRFVLYHNLDGSTERGRIKSWKANVIFVAYKCDGKWNDFMNYTGAATRPEDLTFEESQ